MGDGKDPREYVTCHEHALHDPNATMNENNFSMPRLKHGTREYVVSLPLSVPDVLSRAESGAARVSHVVLVTLVLVRVAVVILRLQI